MTGKLYLSAMLVCLLHAAVALSEEPQPSINEHDTLSSAPAATEKSSIKTGTNQLVLTPEELAGYNGKDGKPAYVAISGVIYELTPIKAWKKGRHHGHVAGRDLTEMLTKKSPHGTKVLKKLKVVGKLVENGK